MYMLPTSTEYLVRSGGSATVVFMTMERMVQPGAPILLVGVSGVPISVESSVVYHSDQDNLSGGGTGTGRPLEQRSIRLDWQG